MIRNYTLDIIQCGVHSYLDHVLGIGSKYRVENKVVQVSMLSREVVIEVDKVFNVEVRPDVANVLSMVRMEQ